MLLKRTHSLYFQWFTTDHIDVVSIFIFYTIQYNTIQYNTIQYNTIQYNTIQYNTIQYNVQCLTIYVKQNFSICSNADTYLY